MANVRMTKATASRGSFVTAAGTRYGVSRSGKLLIADTDALEAMAAEFEVERMEGAGAPTSGTTGAGIAPIGSVYYDTTNKVEYINEGTKASPTWRRKRSIIKQAVVAGGSAGDFTVTGIATTDRLVGVIYFTKSTNLTAVTDLSSEFSITAANTINNAAGTATTGGYLLVTYEQR
ncbi:MAG: hypothetical protein IT562_10855 [Alphaproteobacteria bacterium]|nr:hypothetical protein [Alphaproteobacteria bacterium]